MRITSVHIQNFRSIRDLTVDLGDTTVFIGANNSGKTAILDALRVLLTRRWGQRGTGFTENDVHRPDERGDPKTLPPVQIEIVLEEPHPEAWDKDMVAQLEDVASILPGAEYRNVIRLRGTCAWSEEKDAFEPAWEFLDAEGSPLGGKSQRATNLSGFFSYLPFFWLPAIRDAADEFSARSAHWGRLMRAVRIPEELESEAVQTLKSLDEKIIHADPYLAEIAEMIGQATHIAINGGPGSARLNTLPLTMEAMLQRAGIVLRNEDLRPWLPLGHHGQGLQSLAVIFLFQAAVLQQLKEGQRPGAEPVFAIEEPEAHLHPQAARTLWGRVRTLPGQQLMTTHSPFFVQNVPLHDLRLVRLQDGCTLVSSVPRRILTTLPWADAVAQFSQANPGIFEKDEKSGCVSAISCFSEKIATMLSECYRKDHDVGTKSKAISDLRHLGRRLVSEQEARELGFHGRRIRGEVFFAHRWILVEGVCECLLLEALGDALGWPLDNHGVTCIDFQQAGSPGIYATLAEALGIPWHMIVDGDPQGENVRRQLANRGFIEGDLSGRFDSLPKPNDLEAQLLADGHEVLLRTILDEIGVDVKDDTSQSNLLASLRNRKTAYMSQLARRVAADGKVARGMPKAFVSLIGRLKEGSQ